MAQTAAHLADHVIPPVPVRLWVISVPKRLRGFLADRPNAVAALTKIFIGDCTRRGLSPFGPSEFARMGTVFGAGTVPSPARRSCRGSTGIGQQEAGVAVEPNLGFGFDRPRRQGPWMALPP
jgi:hypothetical protein